MIKLLRKIIIISLSIALLIYFAFKYYSPIEIGEIKSIRVEELGVGSMKLAVVLSIKNKSILNFEIRNVDLEFSINGIKAGKVKDVENVEIRANSSEDISFPAELQLQDFISNFIPLLQSVSSDKAEIKIKGTIKLHFIMFDKELIIDKQNTVPLKK